jgi:AcrR family transcriptional regulator
MTTDMQTPAGRPRSSDREARLHHLIHTAGQLFLKHGYRHVSLEMLAREAHVAVRTIYVKFGGKAGLLKAVLVANRESFFSHDMEKDAGPLKEVLGDFATHYLDLVSMPEALSMARMVVADAPGNAELAQTFFDAGPKPTRDMLARFFARPDIRAQLRTTSPRAAGAPASASAATRTADAVRAPKVPRAQLLRAGTAPRPVLPQRAGRRDRNVRQRTEALWQLGVSLLIQRTDDQVRNCRRGARMSKSARYEWRDQQASLNERMKGFQMNPGEAQMAAVMAEMRVYADAARSGSIEIPKVWTTY